MVILCDKVQAPSDFSYTTSCRCWHTCAPVWTNFGWLYRQGGRLNSNHMLCCCHRVHQPKLLSLDLNFAPTAYLRTGLRRSVQGSVCFCYFPRQYVHAVCDRPMRGARISIWDDHVHTNKSGLRGERPRGDSRISEKVNRPPIGNHLGVVSRSVLAASKSPSEGL
jgi:hypothetical protein